MEISRPHRKVLIPLFSLVLLQHQGVIGSGGGGGAPGALTGMESSTLMSCHGF